MGTSATPISNGLPPLPPGATLLGGGGASGPAGLPPLPPGASLVTPPSAEPAQAAAPSLASQVGDAYRNVPMLPGSDFSKGLVKGGMHTVAGLLNLFAKGSDTLMSTGEDTAQPNVISQHVRDAADWLNSHAQDHGVWQHLGDFGESALELMTPEGLASLAGDAGKVADVAKAGNVAGQVATKAQQLADAAKVAKTLDGLPRVKALVMIGLKAAAKGAAEIGGQSYVKSGGDTDQALRDAAIGGATGGVLAPAGDMLSSAIAKRATTLEDVGGVQTPISAEVRNARGTPQQVAGKQAIQNAAQDTLAQRLGEVNESRAVPETGQAALPASTGPFQFELKTGEPEMRTSDGSTAAEPRKRQIGTQYVNGKGSGSAPKTESYNAGAFQYGTEEPLPPVSDTADFADKGHKEPVFQYLSGTKPGEVAPGTETLGGGGTLRTQDPNIARAHIGRLNGIIDSPEFGQMPEAQQAAVKAARSDAQQQMAQYAEQARQKRPGYGKPNLPQIDIPTTIKQVGSYTQAADHLEKVATDGYNSISDALALNDISGGKFNAIRNANKEAWAAYTGATSPKGLYEAERAIDASNRAMQSLLRDDIGGAVSEKELSGFNDAYGQAQKLRYVANAVDGAFSGNASSAARSWEYRGFNGQQLMGNLNKLVQKFGRPELERVVGRDNLNTLFQVAELNRTNAARGRFGAAVAPIAKYLSIDTGAGALGAYAAHVVGVPWEAGVAAGVTADYAAKRVMNAILTNPKVAQNLIFAIDSGAKPENYGPFIGAMIQQAEQAGQQEKSQ